MPDLPRKDQSCRSCIPCLASFCSTTTTPTNRSYYFYSYTYTYRYHYHLHRVVTYHHLPHHHHLIITHHHVRRFADESAAARTYKPVPLPNYTALLCDATDPSASSVATDAAKRRAAQPTGAKCRQTLRLVEVFILRASQLSHFISCFSIFLHHEHLAYQSNITSRYRCCCWWCLRGDEPSR
jgi:hypothetical protein